MEKFTAGPWVINDTTGEVRIEPKEFNYSQNDGYVIATCLGPDRKANANLIAASWDLLEACKYVLYDLEFSGHPSWDDCVVKLKKAISKAQGLDA